MARGQRGTEATRKDAAKRPIPKASTSKHGVRDRLTPEQRRRVAAYAKSLKGGNAKSLSSDESAKSIDHKTTICSQKSAHVSHGTSYSAGRYSSYQYVPQEQKETETRITKSSSTKTVNLTEGRLADKDPPSSVNVNLSGETPRSLKLCNPSLVKRSKDPPNSLSDMNAKEAAKDPPSHTEELQMATEELQVRESSNEKNDEMEVEAQTTSFSESLNSRWNLLRRGLQAIGLVSADAAGIESSDSATSEVFFDAVEFEVEEHHFVVEDVTSDEDEEICDLRRASLNVPSRGQSWMEPNDNLDIISPKRFSKPDP